MRKLTLETLLTEFEVMTSTQATLLAAFKTSYPAVHDWELLLDCPNSGIVSLGAENWVFRKHGVGLSFQNSKSGNVVDMHRSVTDSALFDDWRLLQYLQSHGFNVELADVQRALKQHESSGRVRRRRINGFELLTSVPTRKTNGNFHAPSKSSGT